jgi:hypothetical protein
MLMWRLVLPDTTVAGTIDRVRTRLRIRAALLAIAAGGSGATAVGLVALLLAAPSATSASLAAVAGAATALWMLRANWTVTPLSAAALIEGDTSLDNLLVTAVELQAQPRPVLAEIREAVERQAAARLDAVDVRRVVPLGQPLAVMLTVLAGASLVLAFGPDAVRVSRDAITAGVEARTRGIDGITVTVTPPAYAGQPPTTVADPVQISVVAGSRISLVVTSAAEVVAAELAGQAPLALTRAAGAFAGEWLADRSTAVAIRPMGGEDRDVKFLSVIVVPDSPPVVRVPIPGKDVAIAGTKGRITVGVDAQDDLGLASLSVRFTKASGGGESLTFTEGEVPLTLNRADGRKWSGRAEWVLDGLELADGDVLVYRAIARDRNPNGSPVQSEQYLIEVGRLAGAIGSGFALPAEEKKYAISQQMVIYKTEQLIASATSKGAPSRSAEREGWLEQNQLLAVEQRMVRAEVVFLGGGEVQDEVEEAAHSHEVTEGRLENTGRAEMLRAINFMSRAETELNAGRAPEALVLEREALKSLERAFDRRRYFLRTLPDRSRIDATRRLTGNLKDARSWTRDRSRVDVDPVLVQDRALMAELAMAANGQAGADAALATRIATLDPADALLQQAAVALATARDASTRQNALWAAMQAVSAHATRHLGAAADVHIALDPMAGRLADELVRPGRGSR